MKYKIGKQSFHFFLFAISFIFFAVTISIKANVVKIKSASNQISPPDSLIKILERVKNNPNSSIDRINLIQELIKQNLYSFAYEQLQYFELESDPLISELRKKIEENYKPEKKSAPIDSVRFETISVIMGSINIPDALNSNKGIISNLNYADPDHPDLLKLGKVTSRVIEKQNQNILAEKAKDEKELSIDISSLKIPKKKYASADLNPADFHKGLRITPVTDVYHDNNEYQLISGGAITEIGINNIFGFGLGVKRGHIRIPEKLLRLKTVQAMLFIRLSSKVLFSPQIGEDVIGNSKTTNSYIFLKYEAFKNFQFKVSYSRNDAAIFFNSEKIIDDRITVNSGKASAFYRFADNVDISLSYELIRSDKSTLKFEGVRRVFPVNIGNNLSFSIKKKFGKIFSAGYEYYFADFENTLPIYYSPQEYKHQSLIASADIVKLDKVEFGLAGKIGYLMKQESMLKELSTKFSYKIYDKLKISIEGMTNFSKRYKENYNHSRLNLSAYWSLLK